MAVLTVAAVAVIVVLAMDRSNEPVAEPVSETEPKPEPVPPVVPEYAVLETVGEMRGGTWGAVLVPTLSRDTTATRRGEIAREIARLEGFERVSLYCSEHAWKADFSRSYGERYPNALRDCALGSLDGAQFTSGDNLY
jgi:hypothetical protein